MDKKVLKFYEAPTADVVELKLKGSVLLSYSDPDAPTGGGSEDIPAENIDEGFGS